MLGLVVLLAVMATGAFLAIIPVYQLRNISTEIAREAMQRVEHLSTIRTELAAQRGAELGYILSQGRGDATEYRTQMDEHWEEVHLRIEEYRALIDDPKRLADYEAFLLHVDDYDAYRRLLINLVGSGGTEAASALFAAYQDDFDSMAFHAHRIRHDELDVAWQLSTVAQGLARRSWYFFLATAAVVGMVEIALGWYIWFSVSGGLSALLEGTRRVAQGDLSKPVPEQARDEFGELARAFNTMTASLQQSEEENVRLHEESLRMREERVRLLRDSLARVVSAQEEERERVGRELHDEAGQALTALQLSLTRLEEEVKPPRLAEQVASLRELAVETMEEIRNLAQDMRPGSLHELGLVPALRGYVKTVSRRVGIPVDLSVEGEEQRLLPEVEVALFRVIQEGLTNMARHSHATHAEVNVILNSDRLEASVEDDGVGFDVRQVMESEDRRPLGLFGIQERVSLLGGTTAIEAEPGGGTRLTISVPLAPEGRAD